MSQSDTLTPNSSFRTPNFFRQLRQHHGGEHQRAAEILPAAQPVSQDHRPAQDGEDALQAHQQGRDRGVRKALGHHLQRVAHTAGHDAAPEDRHGRGFDLRPGRGLGNQRNHARDKRHHHELNGGEPFILSRNEAYIGVLIDDLVTKGVDEPYRMFTSRAEYRILLRQDDADMRLTEKSYQLGLATKERFNRTEEKRKQIEQLIEFCNTFSLKPALINDALESLGTTPLSQGIKLSDLLGRPQISFENIQPHIKPLKKAIENIMPDAAENYKKEIIEAAEIRIKYAGYISREQQAAEKMIRLENIKITGKFDYPNLSQISIEARQKLQAIQPVTLGQASRIPGVSPSDINIMLVLLGR